MEEASASDEHPGLSILDVLRPPTRSELTRKRKVAPAFLSPGLHQYNKR